MKDAVDPFFARVICWTSWVRCAARSRSVSVALFGIPTSGKNSLACSFAKTAASILSVLILVCTMARSCDRFGDCRSPKEWTPQTGDRCRAHSATRLVAGAAR